MIIPARDRQAFTSSRWSSMWPRKESQRPGRSAGCACQRGCGVGVRNKMGNSRRMSGWSWVAHLVRPKCEGTWIMKPLLVSDCGAGGWAEGNRRGCGKKRTQKPSCHLPHRSRAQRLLPVHRIGLVALSMWHVRGLKAESARLKRSHAALVLAVDDTAEFRRHGAVEVRDAHRFLVDCPLLAKDAKVYGADVGVF